MVVPVRVPVVMAVPVVRVGWVIVVVVAVRVVVRMVMAVLVVMADKRDPRFERAAPRFAARVIFERRLGPAEAHRVLALAQGLPQAPETTLILLCAPCGSGQDVASLDRQVGAVTNWVRLPATTRV